MKIVFEAGDIVIAPFLLNHKNGTCTQVGLLIGTANRENERPWSLANPAHVDLGGNMHLMDKDSCTWIESYTCTLLTGETITIGDYAIATGKELEEYKILLEKEACAAGTQTVDEQ